jgi:predicted nucleotidyltransferase
MRMKPEDKVYQAYFELQEKTLYYNQIKECTKLSHSSLQNTLGKFVKERILALEKTKQNSFYIMANKKLFALKFSEIAVRKFNQLNIGVKNPLKHFLEGLPKGIFTIVIFGSASRKEETTKSDIDLLVVSDKKLDLKANKRNAEVASKYPLSIFEATISQFMESKDDVIRQARKTGFPIHKEQNYYEAMLE